MDISETVLQDLRAGKTCIEELRRQAYQSTSNIDVIKEPITYQEFFLNYLLPNKPCILDSWATAGWRSRKEWVTEDNQPDFNFLLTNFGCAEVPVANCDVEEYSSHPKQNMIMKDYITYITQLNKQQDKETNKTECLYLKDWHFTRAFPNYTAYEVPVYFSSDWLNECWDSQPNLSDDYRFVYIGPKNSWTPFHTDVFKSYSWSANIVGCKKWILFPPGKEVHFKDRLGNLAFDLESSDLSDRHKYPHIAEGMEGLKVIQRSGQVLFVPSGWHHQVWNLEDTISINHNWYNGCNIDLCWSYVKSCLGDVEREIADCRDMEGWHQQCQLVLKASCGMDYVDFLKFLQLIANHRIEQINKDKEDKPNEVINGIPNCLVYMPENCIISRKFYDCYNECHASFDLDRVIKIMQDIVTISELKEIDLSGCEDPSDFLQRILNVKVKYSHKLLES